MKNVFVLFLGFISFSAFSSENTRIMTSEIKTVSLFPYFAGSYQEKTTYSLSEELSNQNRGELCFGIVEGADAQEKRLAIFRAATDCGNQTVDASKVTFVRIGNRLAHSGCLAGAGCGRVENVYELEEVDSHSVIGQMTVDVDIMSAPKTYEYKLTQLR